MDGTMDRRALLRGVLAGAVAAPAAGLLTAGTAEAAPAAFDVLLGDVTSGTIYQFARTKPFTRANVKWSFKPSGGHPMEHRVRDTSADGRILLVATGTRDSGVASIRRRSDNKLLWSASLGTYLHSVERAPGTGVVVVAGRSRGPAPGGDGGATKGGRIYVYRPTDRSSRSLVKAQQFDFHQAHGLLWDPQLERMWIIGGSVLQAYRIVTTASSAKLVADPGRRVKVTRGHDLQPDYTSPGRLLFTDTNGVYGYDKTTKKVTLLYGRHHVKSFVRHASGEEMWTGAADGGSAFGTKWVHFNRAGARALETGGGPVVYKARILDPAYL
ncbi:hypothetical protein [Streptomyces griseosporeus]|uniref:hypothetical protein n=1 Tax=Streptomyces griseosporeus TaxID=1910 RepID=UPI00167DEA7C|nr:hypothetical protein [Streptomyces griseosporeus]GHF47177.1 hypothetical protein GCM10018783_15460 [Streptomyces griseosporeus]